MSSADSPGRSISSAEPVLIFDLDGTILTVNSFPHWVQKMLFGHFGNLTGVKRVLLSAQAARILAERKLLRHSHATCKRRFQLLWTRQNTPQAVVEMTESLYRYVRPNLKSLLELVAQNKTEAILATAAAGEYAQSLGSKLGFLHILTTPLCTDQDTLENCKERKRDRVISMLAALGLGERKRIFFTDHEEDLPLIRECQVTLWFGDDRKIPEIKAQVPQAEIIACRGLPSAEIMKLAGR